VLSLSLVTVIRGQLTRSSCCCFVAIVQLEHARSVVARAQEQDARIEQLEARLSESLQHNATLASHLQTSLDRAHMQFEDARTRWVTREHDLVTRVRTELDTGASRTRAAVESAVAALTAELQHEQEAAAQARTQGESRLQRLRTTHDEVVESLTAEVATALTQRDTAEDLVAQLRRDHAAAMRASREDAAAQADQLRAELTEVRSDLQSAARSAAATALAREAALRAQVMEGEGRVAALESQLQQALRDVEGAKALARGAQAEAQAEVERASSAAHAAAVEAAASALAVDQVRAQAAQQERASAEALRVCAQQGREGAGLALADAEARVVEMHARHALQVAILEGNAKEYVSSYSFVFFFVFGSVGLPALQTDPRCMWCVVCGVWCALCVVLVCGCAFVLPCAQSPRSGGAPRASQL